MSTERPYRKGDLVRVWSLQSFHGGGFIEGFLGVVRQDQISNSVIVCVHQNTGLNTSYEVYAKQLELVEPVGTKTTAEETIRALRSKLLAGQPID